MEIAPENFATPSKNVGYIKKEKYPQERSRYLKRLSRLDTTEEPAQANIQGIEINLVKKNSGQDPTVSVLAGNKREDNPPRRPTPRRVALTSEG